MSNAAKIGIRVRIAPSPTGFLHIGTARTALFNWLFARHYDGKFILRIEDTDLERSDKKYEEDILESLRWLGLLWDEEYWQSKRLDIYKKHIQKLLDGEKAFLCYHSIEELEAEKREQVKKREAPRHICSHKKTPSAKRQALSGNGIIRLAVDENSQRIIHFKDIIRGTIEFEQRVIGDLSIAKDPDTPLYNFAAVVDDHEMKISHVIRGEDHIPNTPKQILIAEALGFDLPKYAHLPLILGPDKSKLSKRHGATSIAEYKNDYLPEAMVNFMGFLGFTYSREILTASEMVKEFDLEKVHKSGAIFNIEKLNWTHSQYVKNLDARELKKLTGIKSLPEKAIPLILERLRKLSEVNDFNYFWEEPEYEAELLIWKNSDRGQIKRALELVKETLGSNVEWEVFDEKYIRAELDEVARGQFGGERGTVYWPLRVALTGKRESPDPVQIMGILAKDETLERIRKAIKKLSE